MTGKEKEKEKRGFFRDNGLSLVFLTLFICCAAGQAVAGFLANNGDRKEHGLSRISYGQYLEDAHFWQALSENWESEFLQMGAYVLFTVFLFQKGSSESKSPGGGEEVDEEPEPANAPMDAPWPVRAGGPPAALYRNSLGLAFLTLFAASFILHAVSGAKKYSAQEAEHGRPGVSAGAFVHTSEFWFESMQNWQSEFLAVFSMAVLSVFLRQKGSPESKPLAAPHSKTGK